MLIGYSIAASGCVLPVVSARVARPRGAPVEAQHSSTGGGHGLEGLGQRQRAAGERCCMSACPGLCGYVCVVLACRAV
ncbi:MAG: hypothetical protein J3K34DRAFT_442739 [Monoraphidium minutum]|nr:MAG: hypothetical protein J3K34DRAFT_442739 [Monoraphidium minutum]